MRAAGRGRQPERPPAVLMSILANHEESGRVAVNGSQARRLNATMLPRIKPTIGRHSSIKYDEISGFALLLLYIWLNSRKCFSPQLSLTVVFAPDRTNLRPIKRAERVWCQN